MKKKILSIMLCLLMALSMVTVASAEQTLPDIPTAKKEVVIITLGGQYQAYCFDTYTNDGIYYYAKNADRYIYNGSQWEFVDKYGDKMFTTDTKVHYDSTGVFQIENAVKFFTAIGSGDITQYLDNLQEQIKVSTVVEVLVFVAVAIVGLAFMWWGVRKTARVIMSAFRKGKINL